MDERDEVLLFYYDVHHIIPKMLEQEDGVDIEVARDFTSAVADALLDDLMFRLLVGEDFYKKNEEEVIENISKELSDIVESSGLDEETGLKGIHAMYHVFTKILTSDK